MKRTLSILLCIIMCVAMFPASAFADGAAAGETSTGITTEAVKSIKIKAAAYGIAYNKVKISWQPVNELDGYAVYRATSKTGKYTIKKVTEGTSYINSVKSGKTYYYKVRGYKIMDGEKVYTKYSSFVSAKARIPAPKNIATESAGSCKIKVYWNKVPGADGYKVYSKTGKSGKYTLRKTTSHTACKLGAYYNAKTNQPYTYYYKVKAYKEIKGKTYYSNYSNVVSAREGDKNWNDINKLQEDIILWLNKEGYTAEKGSSDINSDGGEITLTASYSDNYFTELKYAKNDILEFFRDLDNSNKEYGDILVSFTLKTVYIDVVDDGDYAKIFLSYDCDAEYDYPDLDEATKKKYVKRIFELVNKEREKAGVAPLVLNEKLCDMATVKVKEMNEMEYFAHESPVYGSPSEMAKAFGITDRGCGENLAGSSTPESAMDAWMSSKGHRANILNPKYTQIGIACHIESSSGSVLWVQEFIY